MKNIRKGFTLIELLVVVLIIGILASIAIPQYFKVVEKSRVSEGMALISSVKSAQERYLAKGGSYTSNFMDLDILYPNMTATNITTKFYSAAITSGDCGGTPCFGITVTRHTANSSVAARYGNYTLTANVPNNPIVQVSGTNGAELQ